MKKPNRKDFPNNRNGRSRYRAALRKYEDYTKRQQQKVKGKTSKLNIKKFPKGDPRTIEALKKRQGGPNKGKNIVKSSPDMPGNPLNKPLRIKKDGPGRTKNTILKPDSEAKQDLKDQKSKRFGGKLPKGSGIVQKAPKKVEKKKEEKKVQTNELKDKTVEDKISNEEPKKKQNKLKIKSTTKGGPVKDGVEYARSKGDDLAGFRRGKGTRLGEDTRITKSLKKAGFTEDRLARLRKKHADFKAKRKKKKKS